LPARKALMIKSSTIVAVLKMTRLGRLFILEPEDNLPLPWLKGSGEVDPGAYTVASKLMSSSAENAQLGIHHSEIVVSAGKAIDTVVIAVDTLRASNSIGRGTGMSRVQRTEDLKSLRKNVTLRRVLRAVPGEGDPSGQQTYREGLHTKHLAVLGKRVH